MLLSLHGGEDQRRRKARNIFLIAIGVLFFIWTVKFTFPQHSVLSIYSNHSPWTSSSNSSTTSEEPKKPSWNPANASGVIFNASLSSKVAVIIETRFRSNLIPLILHFSTVLGPTWPILIYTSAESLGNFSASASLARYLHSGIIEIRFLPKDVIFTNSDSVNAFMTRTWLWETLAPADHVLIFQADSMLCANAVRSVDEYFDYDLIGAPIAPRLGQGYNGGLSLRNRNTILRILNKWNWEDTKSESDSNRFEDQYYFHRMLDLQKEEGEAGIDRTELGAINLPSIDIAKTFAVETIDYPYPLGVHQVHRWLKESEQELSLDEWCPEYKLCSTEHVVDSPDGT